MGGGQARGTYGAEDRDAEGVERDEEWGWDTLPSRLGGLGQWSNYIIVYEEDVKYGTQATASTENFLAFEFPSEVIMGMGDRAKSSAWSVYLSVCLCVALTGMSCKNG